MTTYTDALNIINDAKDNLYPEHRDIIEKAMPLMRLAPELLFILGMVSNGVWP